MSQSPHTLDKIASVTSRIYRWKTYRFAALALTVLSCECPAQVGPRVGDNGAGHGQRVVADAYINLCTLQRLDEAGRKHS